MVLYYIINDIVRKSDYFTRLNNCPGKTSYRKRCAAAASRKLALFALCLFVCVLFASCGREPAANAEPPVPEDFQPKSGLAGDMSKDDNDTYWADLLSQLSTEEKVGQLFIVRPDQLDMTIDPNYSSGSATVQYITDAMAEQIKAYHLGGVIIFAGNLKNPDQLAEMTADIDAASRVLPFISIDEEGGTVARIAGGRSKGFDVTRYNSAASVAASGGADAVYSMGLTIGEYIRSYGFNLDFAPVADVNTNPMNKVIGNRAFSSDPEEASVMVGEFIDGLHENGVLSCIKHFPGHGDTTNDTHSGYVAVYKTWEELHDAELIPFKNNIGKTDLVMVAHITLSNITTDGLPASLSHELITEKLRGELGFDGLVVTDALAMGAIAQNYSASGTALLAFKAGSDLLLIPGNLPEAYTAVLNAVNAGEINMERLNESVLRILKAKSKLTEGSVIR